MSDIMDAIAAFRVAFRANNLEAPATILLASHEEGDLFLSAVRQDDSIAYSHLVQAATQGASQEEFLQMADGSVYAQVQILGMRVRWPANRVATPDGSWSYE